MKKRFVLFPLFVAAVSFSVFLGFRSRKNGTDPDAARHRYVLGYCPGESAGPFQCEIERLTQNWWLAEFSSSPIPVASTAK
jgi:hypothetical protein